VEHGIEIRKEGYESFSTRLTPRPGFSQELTVVMKKSAPSEKKQAEEIKRQGDTVIRLVRPSAYAMGSSRRDQGRRSNETRNVVLKRPHMGTGEVTNKEFRAFFPDHDSGFFQRPVLNKEDKPCQWSRGSTALYCNWLSDRNPLPPV
jgi:hypothetical protein